MTISKYNCRGSSMSVECAYAYVCVCVCVGGGGGGEVNWVYGAIFS